MYKNYRLYVRKMLQTHVEGNISTFTIGGVTRTYKTFKARTKEEAERKARKYLKNAQIIVAKIYCRIEEGI